jgi:hypothetical protein
MQSKLKIKTAASQYGIPATTVRDRYLGISKQYSTPGPDRLLEPDEEESLAFYARLIYCT